MNSARQSLRRYLTWALACLMLAAALRVGAAGLEPTALVGSWKLYRDDDHPHGPIDEETISFWPSGRFSIAGDSRHQGYYRIHQDELELLAKVGDKGITITRVFKLRGQELQLKNRNSGWAWYRRVSDQPQGAEPALQLTDTQVFSGN